MRVGWSGVGSLGCGICGHKSSVWIVGWMAWDFESVCMVLYVWILIWKGWIGNMSSIAMLFSMSYFC